MSEVTRILSCINNGDPVAAEQLLPLVYQELRVLAASKLAKERPGQTLQATALVHEAYLRLLGDGTTKWDSAGHFFGAAAEAIRRILVETARRKHRVKHGGGVRRIDLDDAPTLADEPDDSILALDEALSEFTNIEPEKADLVKLRYFAGLSIDEAAEVLNISRSTAKRHWAFARAWLLAKLSDDNS